MCTKSTHSLSLALSLVLIMMSVTEADLVGWWKFEEGSGNTAADNSGNGHDGTLLGTGVWGPGPEGQGTGSALMFGPDKCTVVNCGIFDPTDGTGKFSVALWAFWDGTGTFQHFFTKSNTWGADTMMLQVELWGAHTNSTYTDRVGVSYQPAGSVPFSLMPKNEWVHLAFTFDGTNLRLYLNGVDEQGPKPFSIGPNVDAPVLIGASNESEGRIFNGLLDEVRVYSHALSQVEVLSVMKGQAWPYAFGPNPANGTILTATWANLSWSAGDFAASHDLYFGENFDDVNEGTAETFVGNMVDNSIIVGFPTYPVPDGLVPGTTYYWRIDEVNEADPNSPWEGDIWSFSIQPYTAYNPDPADGTGLVDTDAALSWSAGFGAKLHYFFIGESLEDVNSAADGAMAGSTSYSPGALEREKVYYWRVDEFVGPETYKGDVWSFTTAGAAGDPQPANGDDDTALNSMLTWTPAETAVSHDLYFGTDADAVRNATKASPEYMGNKAKGAESHNPGKLAWDTDYFWRVDAVYAENTVKGLVWSFNTADFIVVDGFESYNDIDPPDPASNTIYSSWIDGYGIPTNGALTSEDLPPYAEQTVVHSGDQSMKYQYDTNLMISESTLTLIHPKDWTQEGVTALSLWFRGSSANAAERMFVALNGNAVVYHDDPAASQKTGWNHWVIELQNFADQGVNLANVNTITIGFGTKNTPAAGGAGTVYFDDIRLVRST